MLFQEDPHKKIEICATCKGKGVYDHNAPHHKMEECATCQGHGVYLQDDNGQIVFGMPTYVDYGARLQMRIYKASIIVALLILIAVIGFLIIV